MDLVFDPFYFSFLCAAWSKGRRCGKACKFVRVLLALHSWCNCRNLLCYCANLHVAQGSNCSKGYAYLKKKRKLKETSYFISVR